jgi:transcriptional regulator GlxA family with amidase domain
MAGGVNISILIMQQTNLLDLGCITQVFLGAQLAGMPCKLNYYATDPEIVSSVNLPLGQIKPYKQANLEKGDFLIVTSSYYKYILSEHFQPSGELLNWLSENYTKGVVICSLCNASVLLAKAGLLDNKSCTTNWMRTEILRKIAPKAKVIDNILFCEDNGIITGAGGTACLDLGLYIVSKLGGGQMAYEISKRLLLYNIRKGNDQQISIFLKYRNHTHPGIHKVQDHIVEHLGTVKNNTELARIANMSRRNFTRMFKKETGKTVKEYMTELRVEKASQYLALPAYSKIQIANACGLQSERQLRRIINKVNYA